MKHMHVYVTDGWKPESVENMVARGSDDIREYREELSDDFENRLTGFEQQLFAYGIMAINGENLSNTRIYWRIK